jgi:hypothetical protein
MGGAVRIIRLDLTAKEPREGWFSGAADAGSAMVLEGADRKSAAETCGMDRQTLRDLVHRYNAEACAACTM